MNVGQLSAKSFVRFVNELDLVIQIPDPRTINVGVEYVTLIRSSARLYVDVYHVDMQIWTAMVVPTARLQWLDVTLAGPVTKTSPVTGFHGRLTFENLPEGEYHLSLSTDFSRKAQNRYEIDVEDVNAQSSAHQIYAMKRVIFHQAAQITLEVVSANSRSCKVVIKGHRMANPDLHVRALLLRKGMNPALQATQKVNRDQAIFPRLPKGNYRFEFFVPDADETQEGVI